MFLSALTNSLDAKGRISVPAEFRSVASKQGYEGIICWPSFEGAFLEGAGLEFLEGIRTLMENMDPYDEARLAFERVIFGSAKKLNFDANGRVTLPKELSAHAGIQDSAVFVGLGSRFEIWNPNDYQQKIEGERMLAKELKQKLRVKSSESRGE